MTDVVRKLWFLTGAGWGGSALVLHASLLAALTIGGALVEVAGVGAIPAFVALLSRPDDAMRVDLVRRSFAAVGAHTDTARVLYAASALALTFVVKNALLAAQSAVHALYLRRVQLDLTTRVFRAYLRAPYAFHLGRNTAAILHTTRGATQRIVNDLLFGALRIALGALVLAAVLALLVAVEPVASAAMGLLLGGISTLFIGVARQRITQLGNDEERASRAVIRSVAQGLGAIKEVKVLGHESFFLGAFADHARTHARLAGYRTVAFDMPRLLLETAAAFAMLAVMVTFAVEGRQVQAALPVLALLAVATIRIIPSAHRIVAAVLAMRWAGPALDAVYRDVLQLEAARDVARGPAEGSRRLEHAIELRDVGYRYAGASVDAVTDVSLRIAAGSLVGVVGTSGSGKTTILDIVVGLLEPARGRVLVDGRDIRDDLAGWQRQIGYVPQTTYLVDDTVRRNVALGLPDAEVDDARVWAGIDAAQLRPLVESLPAGLDTLVGERGVGLSGGERQRVGIARALYHDPPVLVLDEATSGLDEATQSRFMEAVVRLRGSRTIVVVAHRYSTVRACDPLFVIRDGRLVDAGSFDQLLATPSSADRPGAAPPPPAEPLGARRA